MIYFIQCQSTNNVKIGYTGGDPEKRKAELQTGSAAGLNLLFTMPGEMSDEKKLHERFAASRVHGEWFRPTHEVLAFVIAETGLAAFDKANATFKPAKFFATNGEFNYRLDSVKIYLAGSIKKNCWRHNVVKGLRGAIEEIDSGECASSALHQFWPTLHHAIFGRHHYVGPYFTSCDHGCFHGEDSHGVGASVEKKIHDAEEKKGDVVQVCLQAIHAADLVFAWIDSLDCYGTITELGYARAIGKTVCVCGPRAFRDMWFLYTMADFTVFVDSPPETVLRNYLEITLTVPVE